MSTSEPQIPLHVITSIDKALGELVQGTKYQTAATLAAGVIAASGRAHSIGEAKSLTHDVYYAMYPAPQSPAYKDWAKTSVDRVKKPTPNSGD